MPSCVACGAELELSVRAPHTVYVMSLYRIGGQDYCRHDITRAAVAAGVVTEVKLSRAERKHATGAVDDQRKSPG